jgi:hypothetical protein
MSKRGANPSGPRGAEAQREDLVFIPGEDWMLLTGARSGGGGAYRDRTDDLKLAKLALSQLS